eukprot:1001190-Amorphochlora_amoeboformis.AAC.1
MAFLKSSFVYGSMGGEYDVLTRHVASKAVSGPLLRNRDSQLCCSYDVGVMAFVGSSDMKLWTSACACAWPYMHMADMVWWIPNLWIWSCEHAEYDRLHYDFTDTRYAYVICNMAINMWICGYGYGTDMDGYGHGIDTGWIWIWYEYGVDMDMGMALTTIWTWAWH